MKDNHFSSVESFIYFTPKFCKYEGVCVISNIEISTCLNSWNKEIHNKPLTFSLYANMASVSQKCCIWKFYKWRSKQLILDCRQYQIHKLSIPIFILIRNKYIVVHIRAMWVLTFIGIVVLVNRVWLKTALQSMSA